MKKFFTVILSSIYISSFSQSVTGQFIKDHRTNCQVWDENYAVTDSITWSGRCNNTFADGQGTLLWYENKKLIAQYDGQMKNGKPNGQGKYKIYSYGIMEGNFENGNLQGKGKVMLDNGGRLIGNFVNGEFLNLDRPYLRRLKKLTSPIKDNTNIYENDNGSTELFYYILKPKDNIKSVLVLLPSTNESAENVISCNKQLIEECFNNHILISVLSINYNKPLESDDAALHFLNTTFEDIILSFNAPEDKFVLSGLSLGGGNALQYTEMSRNPKYKTSIQPIAVIGVDPPVDEADLYYNAKEAIERYKNDSSVITKSIHEALVEDNFLIEYFHKVYGGSPAEFPGKYIESSTFSRTQADGGNAKYLIDLPVRLYSDPDILWNLKYKNRDYYHMNAANLSALTNFLMLKGNKRVEFIPAIGKGYRVDGTRHPHSWSIVEPTECVKWIRDLTN